jgi:hypothetical protein
MDQNSVIHERDTGMTSYLPISVCEEGCILTSTSHATIFKSLVLFPAMEKSRASSLRPGLQVDNLKYRAQALHFQITDYRFDIFYRWLKKALHPVSWHLPRFLIRRLFIHFHIWSPQLVTGQQFLTFRSLLNGLFLWINSLDSWITVRITGCYYIVLPWWGFESATRDTRTCHSW